MSDALSNHHIVARPNVASPIPRHLGNVSYRSGSPSTLAELHSARRARSASARRSLTRPTSKSAFAVRSAPSLTRARPLSNSWRATTKTSRSVSSRSQRTAFVSRSVAQTSLTSRSWICRVSSPVIRDVTQVSRDIGIIAHEGSSGKPGDVALVESLVETYITRPSCLILLTVSCESTFLLLRGSPYTN
jgi:hypothetical protein